MLQTNLNQLLLILILSSCVVTLVFILSTTNLSVTKLECCGPLTFAHFEKFLCEFPLPAATYDKEPKACPRGIVTVHQGGRLCNQIWEYAAVWAVAKKTGLKPYVPTCLRNNVSRMFETSDLTVGTFADIANCPLEINSFVESELEMWNKLTNLVLPIYTTEPEIVLTYLQDIPKEFVIKRYLLEEAQRQLRDLMPPSNATFVGVHVRKQDYDAFLERRYNAKPADLDFYETAMLLLERKFLNVIFVVVSDEPDWCVKNFKERDNLFVIGKDRENSPELDLAILSSCNHTIFDYGTYGAWGAVMAGGETIYYEIPQHFTTRIGKVMKNWRTL